jgi:hypothetical protein
VTLVILNGSDSRYILERRHISSTGVAVGHLLAAVCWQPFASGHLKDKYSLMSDSISSTPKATDWTNILSDPDLVRNVGKLLQA